MEVKNIIEILLIEDNPAEIRLITEAFNEGTVKTSITVVTDGAEATDYLYKIKTHMDIKVPALIILDLNLPKKNGMEVLKEIKADDKLKRIPVIVLTGSNDDNDIFESYGHHVNAYITKSIDFNKFRKDICAFKNFWFNNAVLPV